MRTTQTLRQCKTKTPWGRCGQPPYDPYEHCGYHLRRIVDSQNVLHSDSYYEQKVVAGLIEPTDHWLSKVEDDALFRGRAHNDGRRLDHWARV